MLRLRAHAKLNLALAVGPPIAGPGPHAGYHPIASWMAPIGLADEIEIAPAARTSFDIAWADGAPVEWPLDRDLAVRAHRALEAHVGRPLPVAVRVRKSIPAGGGLGGGSSDAAATVRGVVELLGLSIDERTLHALAGSLGSDVAFFIDAARPASQPPRAAVVEGLGERVRRLERGPATGRGVVLFFPPFGCATAEVYRAYDRTRPPPLEAARVAELAGAAALVPERLFNDLAAAAEAVEPRLAEMRAGLAQRLRVPVHVSGSGSTLFACIDGPAAGGEGGIGAAMDAARAVGVGARATTIL